MSFYYCTLCVFSREHLVHYKRSVRTPLRIWTMTAPGPSMSSSQSSYSFLSTTVPKSGMETFKNHHFMIEIWFLELGLIYSWILQVDCIWFESVLFSNRSHAIACVNQFIISRTQALMVHIDSFIEVNPVPSPICNFKWRINFWRFPLRLSISGID